VGPMLNGYMGRELTGSGMVVWSGREQVAKGEITLDEFFDRVASSTPSVGHCNTFGTASTMNALAESLGMALPGSASIPAPYRERSECAYLTGLRIVDMVREDLKPSDILTRESFENAIVVNSAIGGSTNAPIHLNAIAKHMGVSLNNDDWQKIGHPISLLLNVQPAGEWLCEEYHRAGGLPAVIAELIAANILPHPSCINVNGKSIEENCKDKFSWDRRVIKRYDEPLMKDAGFLNLKGSLFDSAIMKTCVISDEFRERYLSNPKALNVIEGKVVVFDGPEHYHDTLEETEMDEFSILVMRQSGVLGYPGAAETVNMHYKSSILKKGATTAVCIGDGRQSGTSGSPSILNASPEAALNGGLAILRNGDKVRIDLNKGSADIMLSPEVIRERKQTLIVAGGYPIPASQTPWQEIFRNEVGQLDGGMVFERAVKYHNLGYGFVPRDNH